MSAPIRYGRTKTTGRDRGGVRLAEDEEKERMGGRTGRTTWARKNGEVAGRGDVRDRRGRL